MGPPEEPSAPPSPVAHYAAPPGGTDEFLDPDGHVRAPWRQVAEALDGFGADGLASREEELTRLLRSEGATYNANEGTRSVRRPWSLDLVPLVLDHVEWAGLEAAVAQRVALLDLVNDDLYGDRTLVARGLVPAEIVLADPAFLRACTGITVPGARRLFTVAVDVVREAGGGFRAVTDRTQAPSGLGYTLVNRSALSRVLPALHRASGVERLAGFVRAIRAGVARAAPDGADEPRVVILTPGPLSETYFEHAYLASYLGYPLVEGRDLVVQNNRVWLRSLAGLDPVDVVLRRVDDAWCDPVELRSDSLLGVPGLMEVVRRGRVAVLNPLGSGILESPALAGLFDELAPALLGEELRLRGPQSWWCGRPEGLSHVLSRLDQLVLLPVSPTVHGGPVLPSRLAAGQQEQLRDRVRSRPDDWVGQELLAPSTVPTVTADGRLVPRPVVLRTFAVADGAGEGAHGHGFQLLPGGLTRVGVDPDSSIVTGHGDSTSKDTWVASTEPAFQQSPWLPSARAEARPIPIPEAPAALPGRVAAQLFVLGRSAEHAELVIRLIRTVLARLDQPLGAADGGGAQSLQVLLSALGSASGFDPDPESSDGPPEARTGSPGGSTAGPPPTGSAAEGALPNDRTALALLFDEGVAGSLASTLGVLIESSYSVREQLSSDTWQLVGDIEEELGRFRRHPPTQFVGAQPSLLRLQRSLLALSGVSAENMERDPAWLFLDGGRRLERALGLVRLLRSVLVDRRAGVVEDLLVESLLTTSESLIIFRRRAGSILHVAGAIDLLVYDVANPRSVLYQLDRLVDHLNGLPKQSSAQRLGNEERLALEATTLLRLTDPDTLAAVDEVTGRRTGLDSVFAKADGLLVDLLDSLRRTYFAHERLSILAGRRPEDIDGGR
ncbi:MAG: circularly permuted type 2 ATP-grasp protein [Acidimicrobiales bacterium]